MEDYANSNFNNIRINFSSIEDLSMSSKLLPPIGTENSISLTNTDNSKI